MVGRGEGVGGGLVTAWVLAVRAKWTKWMADRALTRAAAALARAEAAAWRVVLARERASVRSHSIRAGRRKAWAREAEAKEAWKAAVKAMREGPGLE